LERLGWRHRSTIGEGLFLDGLPFHRGATFCLDAFEGEGYFRLLARCANYFTLFLVLFGNTGEVDYIPLGAATDKGSGDYYQLIVGEDALCGAFVENTKWLESVGMGLAAGGGGVVGLVVTLLVLPVFAWASYSRWRKEKAIKTLDPRGAEFETIHARNFRWKNSQIEALFFCPPASGARFSGQWQLEMRLKNGESRRWILSKLGLPKAEIKALRLLEVPVHVG
jgi:hypothetical protein